LCRKMGFGQQKNADFLDTEKHVYSFHCVGSARLHSTLLCCTCQSFYQFVEYSGEKVHERALLFRLSGPNNLKRRARSSDCLAQTIWRACSSLQIVWARLCQIVLRTLVLVRLVYVLV
jgi:hypothetical protein